MISLDDAINSLFCRGYLISSIRNLSGGVNSSVFEVICSDGSKKVLKLYPKPSSFDSRKRGEAEIVFYKYLYNSRVSNVPSILDYDSEFQWSLISWIDGERLYAFETKHLLQVVNFIRDINASNICSYRQMLPFASDACQSLLQVLDSIKQRIIRFKCISPKSIIGVRATQFIINEISPYFETLSHKLLDNNSKPHWYSSNLLYVASPSDIGINNLLQSSGQLYFFDFEYAGLDDLAKLASDFIVHPEFPLRQIHAQYFIDALSAIVAGANDSNWRERVNDLLEIFVVKWSLIMLNQYFAGNLTEPQLNKAISYFRFMKRNRPFSPNS